MCLHAKSLQSCQTLLQPHGLYFFFKKKLNVRHFNPMKQVKMRIPIINTSARGYEASQELTWTLALNEVFKF